jgi:hypothetical protein
MVISGEFKYTFTCFVGVRKPPGAKYRSIGGVFAYAHGSIPISAEDTFCIRGEGPQVLIKPAVEMDKCFRVILHNSALGGIDRCDKNPGWLFSTWFEKEFDAQVAGGVTRNGSR